MHTDVIQKGDTIAIQGAITFDSVSHVQKDIMQILQKPGRASEYRVDLLAVAQVNSAALGLLVELKKYALVTHLKIVFINLPERLLALAQVCGVSSWLEFSA